ANDDTLPIQDILLEPEVDLYAKSQALGLGVVPISAVPPRLVALYGKGVRPPKVTALRVTEPHPVNAYGAGEDVVVKWGYPASLGIGTGAGMQGAGVAVGVPDPVGDFTLEILTGGDVLKRTETLSSPEYTYTNVNLQADLGGEVDFKVRVTQLRSGYASDTVIITVEKI
ncbi:unnamed protein product, partial [marine sediment metagenome]